MPINPSELIYKLFKEDTGEKETKPASHKLLWGKVHTCLYQGQGSNSKAELAEQNKGHIQESLLKMTHLILVFTYKVSGKMKISCAKHFIH